MDCDNQKIMMLRKLVDESADPSVLALYLKIARSKILERLYPIGDKDRDSYTLPSFYDMLQVQIAQYYYNNAGTYGLMSHTEQGVTDTFASADIPQEFTKYILPYCSIPSKIGGKKNADGEV